MLRDCRGCFIKDSHVERSQGSAPSERPINVYLDMIISVYSAQPYDCDSLSEVFDATLHQLNFFNVNLNAQTAPLAEGSQAVCAFVNDRLDEPCLIELAKHGVRFIFLRCAGFNQVDLNIAQNLGIQVFRVPAYSPESVAEHAVALLLTLNRKTHKAYNRVRESNFSLDRLTGFQIYGKTIGIVGTGKIGAAFARIMRGFGCKLIAFDPFPSETLTDETGLTYLSLPQLLAQADIISLHCPLRPENRHLINAETLKLIKPGAMLINTSRGGLVDTQAAIDALQSGHLGYLGIDVYEQEESLFFRDRSEQIIDDNVWGLLLHFPNVLVTAHQAFFTKEALLEIAQTTLGNVEAAENQLHTDTRVTL